MNESYINKMVFLLHQKYIKNYSKNRIRLNQAKLKYDKDIIYLSLPKLNLNKKEFENEIIIDKEQKDLFNNLDFSLEKKNKGRNYLNRDKHIFKKSNSSKDILFKNPSNYHLVSINNCFNKNEINDIKEKVNELKKLNNKINNKNNKPTKSEKKKVYINRKSIIDEIPKYNDDLIKKKKESQEHLFQMKNDILILKKLIRDSSLENTRRSMKRNSIVQKFSIRTNH